MKLKTWMLWYSANSQSIILGILYLEKHICTGCPGCCIDSLEVWLVVTGTSPCYFGFPFRYSGTHCIFPVCWMYDCKCIFSNYILVLMTNRPSFLPVFVSFSCLQLQVVQAWRSFFQQVEGHISSLPQHYSEMVSRKGCRKTSQQLSATALLTLHSVDLAPT